MWKVNGILTPEQESAGFEVLEEEDFVYLKRSGKTLVVFAIEAVTPQLLREAADAHAGLRTEGGGPG